MVLLGIVQEVERGDKVSEGGERGRVYILFFIRCFVYFFQNGYFEFCFYFYLIQEYLLNEGGEYRFCFGYVLLIYGYREEVS